ncbi:MAG: hypothetical protein QG573_532 [Acidobacteriota bacterium]|nr:hypothetical protein [Acidobacteriota bacterium]
MSSDTPSHRRTRVAVACALIALVGAPARSRAEPSQADRVQALRHIQQAEAHYRVSNYPAALASYQAAYRLDPRPDLLFNLARCHEVMAQLPEAIGHYQRYLEEKPQAEDAALVRARLESLRARRAGELARERAAPKPRAQTQQLPRGSSWRTAAGWTALGVGGASLLAGIVCGALARAKADEFTDGASQNRTYAALSEVDRAGRRYQAAQIGTLIAGGVLVAAGGGLLIFQARWRDAREARSTWIAPLLGGAQLGIAASGSF